MRIGLGIGLNRFRGGQAAPAGLLDQFTGAAAAFSLDTLIYSDHSVEDTAVGSQTNGSTDTYTVRVRRSSDNAVRSFTHTEVGDGTLVTWVGAGNDGFVEAWYNQGSASDAVQTTAANQPKIVSIGQLILENGKAALEFNGSNDYLNLGTFTHSDFTAFCVTGSLDYTEITSMNARFFDIITNLGSLQLLNDSPTSNLHMKNSQWQLSITATGFEEQVFNQNLMSSIFKSTENLLFVNGLQLNVIPTAGSVGAAGTLGRIGVRADLNTSTFLNGNYQTLIIYPSDQSTNRNAIESALNDYYEIY